jgi:hypothetical protein
MIKAKKSGLALALALLAAAVSIFMVVFVACGNVSVNETSDPTLSPDPDKSNPGNSGYAVVPGTGVKLPDVPYPVATIVKGAAASTNWPDINGRIYPPGYNVPVDRWQLKVEWKTGLTSEAAIEAAIKTFYDTYKEWEIAFDPLPYFLITINDPQPYHGSNGYNSGSTWGDTPGVGNWPVLSSGQPFPKPFYFGREEVRIKANTYPGGTVPWAMNQSSNDSINFVRYWPTDNLTVDAWNAAGASQAKIAAYKAVIKELKQIVKDIGGSQLAQKGVPGYEKLVYVKDSLTGIYGTEHVTFANYTDFNWFAGTFDLGPFGTLGVNSYVTYQSDRLYEAYFGYIPDAKYYSTSGDETYPQN